jgi:hypothetical protein
MVAENIRTASVQFNGSLDRCEEDVIIACGLYLLAEEETIAAY